MTAPPQARLRALTPQAKDRRRLVAAAFAMGAQDGWRKPDRRWVSVPIGRVRRRAYYAGRALGGQMLKNANMFAKLYAEGIQ